VAPRGAAAGERCAAIELEENTEQLDPRDYEASKARPTEIRKIEEELPGDVPEKSGARGRPREPSATSTSPEQYPVFKRPEWRQYSTCRRGQRQRA
jgi:hypothetical protein